EVMNRKQARHSNLPKLQICACQSTWPVIGMQQIGLPAGIALTAGQLNRRERKPGEAQIVVRPVVARNVRVWRSGTLVEQRTNQEKTGHPVPRLGDCKITRRNVRHAVESSHRVQLRFPVRAGAIERHENTCIDAKRAQSLGNGRRNIRNAACLDVAGEFRGEEKNIHGARAALTVLWGSLRSWLW